MLSSGVLVSFVKRSELLVVLEGILLTSKLFLGWGA